MGRKVSIITITYNAERFIEHTIQSVLGQKCKDFEYVIIDGASSDKTMDIVRLYASQHDEFKWVSEPDGGLYDAMNKGLHKATGDFVWFINAGDKLYDENTLQTVVDKINAYSDCDVVYGQTLIIGEDEKPLGDRNKLAPSVLNKKSLLNGLVVCHQSILVRKSIAPDYDTQYKITADYDWTCNVLSCSRRNCFIDEYISRFMVAGVSTQQRKKSWLERYRIMKKQFGLFRTLLAHLKIIVCYPFTRKY